MSKKLDLNTALGHGYTVADLSISETAREKGLDNRPPEKYYTPLSKLADILDMLESKFGGIKILSAYRSPEVNEAVGGSPTSRHKKGEAVDFYPLMQTTEEYFVELLTDPEVLTKLGEVTLKPPHNSIHVTLPYGATKGSVRILRNGTYQTMKQEEINKLVSKHRPERNPPTIMAGMNMWTIVAASMAAIASLFAVRNIR